MDKEVHDCKWCHNPFTQNSEHQKFCSTHCRVKHFNKMRDNKIWNSALDKVLEQHNSNTMRLAVGKLRKETK